MDRAQRGLQHSADHVRGDGQQDPNPTDKDAESNKAGVDVREDLGDERSDCALSLCANDQPESECDQRDCAACRSSPPPAPRRKDEEHDDD